MIIFHAAEWENCELRKEEKIFVDGILNFAHCERWKSHTAQVHNFNFSKKRLSIVSRVHMAMANDDEKVIEDEIAFFTALISYSTFYGVAHYFLPHDPNAALIEYLLMIKFRTFSVTLHHSGLFLLTRVFIVLRGGHKNFFTTSSLLRHKYKKFMHAFQFRYRVMVDIRMHGEEKNFKSPF